MAVKEKLKGKNYIFTPYVPVIGSLNNGMCGGAKVNTTNNSAIRRINEKASFGDLHGRCSALNSFVSKINETAADIKNIAILIQSGDLPNTPL